MAWRKRFSLFDTINIILMLCLVVVTLYPFLNLLAVSLNDSADAMRGGIKLWPRVFTLENYKYVFSYSNVGHATMISALRAIIGTLVSVFCTAMVAYTISRRDFVLRKFVTVAFILTMYVNGGLIPTYLLIRDLGLLNTFAVYILPGVIGVFNMIVIRSFIEGLPSEIMESAKIDGAGDFGVFFKIVLPLTIPALATVSLFVAVWQWNSWFDVFLYTSSRLELSTLQYELQKVLLSTSVSQTNNPADAFSQAEGGGPRVTPTTIRATMTIVASVPIIMVYPFLQKYFVQGMTLGGVKE